MLSAFWDERSKVEEVVWVSVYCPFAINEKQFLSFKMLQAALSFFTVNEVN